MGSLYKKILFRMVFLLLLSGSAITLFTRAIVFRVLKDRFELNGITHAKSIAANSLRDVLTLNTPRLKKLVENEKMFESGTAYIFIVDAEGRVLAHTFRKGFPTELIKANEAGNRSDFNIQLLDTRRGIIYDIAVPILLDKSLLGQVRLGILQHTIQQTIAWIDLDIMLIMLVVMLIGVVMAQRFSVLLTRPIARLVGGIQAVQEGDFSTRLDAGVDDEIGLLSRTFNEMSERLRRMMGEVERLTKYKERERIAYDLHDSCAQDMANFIKRLELCERLFKIEPAKAIEELNALKETARGLLNRTRHIIYELKLPEDDDFDLLERIRAHIMDFQAQNDIAVRLKVSGSIDKSDFSSDKLRSILFIITEALTNIKKHAQAKNVEVRLESNNVDELTVAIKDDGKGFDVEGEEACLSGCRKLGLMSMRQRARSLAAALSVVSVRDRGTEICVRIPFNAIQYNI